MTFLPGWDHALALCGFGLVACTTTTSAPHDATGRDPSMNTTTGAPAASSPVATASPTATTPASTATSPASSPTAYTGQFAKATGFAAINVGGEARRVYVYVPPTLAAHPPLVVVFHGTGANESDDALDAAIGELGAREVADAQGFLLVAPMSTGDGGTNADHESGGPGWRFGDATHDSPDLPLVRASIDESVRAFHVDPARVYFLGHSNGAFFSYYAAMKVRDRVAAFAETSGGLIPCGQRVDCEYAPRGATSCAKVLSAAPSACMCPIGDAPFPVSKPAGRVPPGFLKHNADDSTVSAIFTCRLAEHLGDRATVVIDGTGEHGPTNDYFAKAWAFFATKTLAP